jgi:L-histidine N-alpha-methyltransferase
MHSSTRTEPRIQIDVILDEEERRASLYDTTFWTLRQSPREIPAVWLYDERGSYLFDEITRLPEYYPTRCEREILAERAQEIAEQTGARTLVELGSGTSDKTRLLLDALSAAGTLERFVPLDVSEEILRSSAHSIAREYASVGIHAIVGDFERHLSALPSGDRRLVAFLGSTIGNLDPAHRAQLLASVASLLQPEDGFLLGIDLVKDAGRLEAAYNDSRGVTEAFVRNGFAAVNRALGANFVSELFDFSAAWNADEEWMDIGFTARTAHSVTIPELEVVVPFAAGERLRFEISAKFRRERLESELRRAGLQIDAWWTDRNREFAVLLATRSPADES